LAEDDPGREREWAAAVEDARARVEAALRQHRASAKAPDGLLAPVDETRPTLARQANELRHDHDEFLAQVVALGQQVRDAAKAFQPAADSAQTVGAAGVVDFRTIRERAQQLLAGLQENKEAETKLVLESVTTDIGVGD
jgi:hypothetical protein